MSYSLGPHGLHHLFSVVSQSLFKFVSIGLVRPPNHLIFFHPLDYRLETVKLGLINYFRSIYAYSLSCSLFRLLSLFSGEEKLHLYFLLQYELPCPLQVCNSFHIPMCLPVWKLSGSSPIGFLMEASLHRYD